MRLLCYFGTSAISIPLILWRVAGRLVYLVPSKTVLEVSGGIGIMLQRLRCINFKQLGDDWQLSYYLFF
jgi:hypothetical protein